MNKNLQILTEHAPPLSAPVTSRPTLTGSKIQHHVASEYGNFNNLGMGNINILPLRQTYGMTSANLMPSFNNNFGREGLAYNPNTRKVYFTYYTNEYRPHQEPQAPVSEPPIKEPPTQQNQWQTKYHQLHKKFQQTLQQQKKLTKKLSILTTSLSTLQNENTALKKSAKEAEQEANRMKEQLREAHQEEVIGLELELGRLRGECRGVGDENRVLKGECERLEGDLLRMERVVGEAMDRERDIMNEKEELMNLNKNLIEQNNSLQSNYQTIQSQLSTLQQTTTTLHHQAKTLQSHHQHELQSLTKQLTTLQTQLQAQQTLNQQLSSQLQHEREQLSSRLAMIQEMKDTIEGLNREREGEKEREREREREWDGRFEERLGRVRGEYERKERKLEGIIQEKVKVIQQIQRKIKELQLQTLKSKQQSQKNQKLYHQKHHQLQALRKLHQKTLQNNPNPVTDQQTFYEQKYYEISEIAKSQGQKIKKLQKQVLNLQELLDKYQNDFNNEEKLNRIQEAFEDAKNRVLEKGGMAYDQISNQITTYNNGKIFEEKLIYELKGQNQRLKTALLKKTGSLPIELAETSLNKLAQAYLPNKHTQSGKLSMLLKNTINDTYNKIQTMLNQISSCQMQYSLQSKSRSTPPKLSKQHQKRKKKNSNNIYAQKGPLELSSVHENLEVLKLYLTDMNQTYNKLMVRLEKEEIQSKIKEKHSRFMKENQEILTSMMPKELEMLEFYKEKNKQLEERVDQLINLNKMLKQRIIQAPTNILQSQTIPQKQLSSTSKQTYPSTLTTQSVRATSPQKITNQHFLQSQIKMLKKDIDQKQQKYLKYLQKSKILQKQKQQLQSKLIIQELQTKKYLKNLQENNAQLATIPKLNQNIYELQHEKQRLQGENKDNKSVIQRNNAKIQELMRMIESRNARVEKVGSPGGNRQNIFEGSVMRSSNIRQITQSKSLNPYPQNQPTQPTNQHTNPYLSPYQQLNPISIGSNQNPTQNTTSSLSPSPNRPTITYYRSKSPQLNQYLSMGRPQNAVRIGQVGF